MLGNNKKSHGTLGVFHPFLPALLSMHLMQKIENHVSTSVNCLRYEHFACKWESLQLNITSERCRGTRVGSHTGAGEGGEMV